MGKNNAKAAPVATPTPAMMRGVSASMNRAAQHGPEAGVGAQPSSRDRLCSLLSVRSECSDRELFESAAGEIKRLRVALAAPVRED